MFLKILKPFFEDNVAEKQLLEEADDADDTECEASFFFFFVFLQPVVKPLIVSEESNAVDSPAPPCIAATGLGWWRWVRGASMGNHDVKCCRRKKKKKEEEMYRLIVVPIL